MVPLPVFFFALRRSNEDGPCDAKSGADDGGDDDRENPCIA